MIPMRRFPQFLTVLATLFVVTAVPGQISPEDTVLIVDYLSTKSLFAAKCTVCHTKEKVFDSQQTLSEWQATVKKMAEKQPDLFTPGDAKALSAYLVLVLGSPAGAGGK